MFYRTLAGKHCRRRIQSTKVIMGGKSWSIEENLPYCQSVHHKSHMRVTVHMRFNIGYWLPDQQTFLLWITEISLLLFSVRAEIQQSALARLFTQNTLCSTFLWIYAAELNTFTMQQSFLISCSVLSQSRNSPHFMETKGSLPHSQVSATCPYPKPHRSSPYPHIPLPEDPS